MAGIVSPSPKPGADLRLSVIVVTYRRTDLALECIEAAQEALEFLAPDAELIVVGNGSGPDAAALIRSRHPSLTFLDLQENVGYTPAMMHGLGRARGRWIALVNDDANVERDAFAHMLSAAESDSEVGSVAIQIRFHGRPEMVNSAGIDVDGLGIAYERLAGTPIAGEPGGHSDVFGPTGCVALYRRSMLDRIGGFDESFFAYLEDADVAWRARMAGWRCVYVPQAIAYHHGSVTTGERSHFKYWFVGRNRVRLLAKNATRAQLVRYALPMLFYDVAYVVFAGLTDRTLAPLKGRIAGIGEWRTYRSRGAALRRPVELAPVSLGWRNALAQRRAYSRGAAVG